MPPATYTEPVKIHGDWTPTYFLEFRLLGPATGISNHKLVFNHESDVPDSFAQGMREIEEGHAVDFDSALQNPPSAV